VVILRIGETVCKNTPNRRQVEVTGNIRAELKLAVREFTLLAARLEAVPFPFVVLLRVEEVSANAPRNGRQVEVDRKYPSRAEARSKGIHIACGTAEAVPSRSLRMTELWDSARLRFRS
jgi:hypothetical protein